MEIVIILIIIGIVGYVIYSNMPSSKFEGGKKLLSEKKFSEATVIFENLLTKHPDAPSKLAECYLMQGNIEKSSGNFTWFEKIFELKKRLNSTYNVSSFELIEAKASYEIALNEYTKGWKISESSPIEGIEKLKGNIRYINSCVQKGMEQEFSTLRNNHFVQISEVYFKRAQKFEKENSLLDAISSYTESLENQPSSNKGQNYFDIYARREICRIQIGEVPEYGKTTSVFDEVNKASAKIKTDYYYRYALKMIAKNKAVAEEITMKYLPSENENVQQLKRYFLSFKRKEALTKVNDINAKLEELFNNQFPIEKTKIFYESIDRVIPQISGVFPELKQKLEEIKPSLFNKLLISSIDNSDYSSAINLITGFQKFWTIPELLKNLGICCFGITNQGKLNDDNYKIVISSWLTAIYSDEVILKSLDSTSWDDEYTFTLVESIGSKYGNHSSVPDNINYDDVTDRNISIGTTQRELLTQFENIINTKFENEAFSRKIHQFYEKEKNSIENVIEIVPNEVLFAAPYFATKYSEIAIKIIDELNDDYSEYSNEEALKAGIAYFNPDQNNGINSDTVGEYYQAHQIKKEFFTALKSLNTDKLIEIKNDSNKKKIVNKYPVFRDAFEEEIFIFFNAKIEEDDENEKLISPLAQSINLFNSGNKLRYQYSNFVTNLTVSKVNADTMTNYKALQNMKNAYFSKMDISRVCVNLVAIIRMNLLDIINDRVTNTAEIYKLLDAIKKEKSTTYKNHCGELTKVRKELLAQFPADARALILAGNNLSAEGLKIRKGLQYMVELGDGDDFTDLSDLFKK